MSRLKCPACAAPRDERYFQCPMCQRYWVVPDELGRNIPPVKLRFKLPALWSATRLCAAGFERSDHIEHPCALCVEEFEKLRLVNITPQQRRLVEHCLSALHDLYRFSVSQNVTDLYDAWLELIPAASELQGRPLAPDWDANVIRKRRTTGMIEFVHSSDLLDLSNEE